ncbi:MAG: cache domain-containing protein, partial [Clostridium sp.]|nr:cache domain-containing protein [Clostridium sp.]
MKKNRKSLHKQIIVLLIIAIVVPITIVSAINFYVLNLSINSNFKQMATSNLGNVIDIISDISKNNKESIEMLSEDPNARSILEAQENKLWLRKFLDSFKKSHEGVASVYMATINKEMIMVPDNSIPKDFDPSSREWYKKAMENQGKVIITNPYVDISNEKQYDVTFAKTVKDASGKIVGVIAIDITLDQLSNKVSSITMGKSGYAVVIDSNGVIIAHKSI